MNKIPKEPGIIVFTKDGIGTQTINANNNWLYLGEVQLKILPSNEIMYELDSDRLHMWMAS